MFFGQLLSSFLKTDKDSVFKNFPDFEKKRNKLLTILNRHSTPLFLIDKDTVLERFRRLSLAVASTWGNDFKIAYSFKTNYDLAKSKILKEKRVWAEVVSGLEYNLAKRLGYKGAEIIFNGPLKTDTELKRALTDGALIQLDNMSELLRLISFGKGYFVKARLGLRMNVAIPYLSRSRFGFSVDSGQAEEALRILKNHNLNLTSLHLHIGSDVDKIESYRSSARSLAYFYEEARKVLGSPVSISDMGGGFPGSGLSPFGKESWEPQPIEKYLEAITSVLKATLPNSKQIKLIFEPGRYLTDDAGLFFTKVYDVRYEGGAQKILSDGTATMLPLKYYRPQLVKFFSPKLREKKGSVGSTVVYGASCREDDLITSGKYPVTMVGDYVVFYCVGAYNQSSGSDFIFGKPKTIVF